MIYWIAAVVLCARFVWWPIIKSELDDANQMIDNEIKNRNDEGY